MPLQLAQMPSACANAFSSGYATVSIDSEIGTSSAAPNPLMARPAISTAPLGATAQTNEPAMNSPMPA